MATGTAPHTTAHGVKIEPMNITVTASAVTSGASVGDTSSSTWSGAASCTRVTRVLRRSVGRPVTQPRGASSQSGSPDATIGGRTKLYGGGGEGVAHSSVAASQGLSPAG